MNIFILFNKELVQVAIILNCLFILFHFVLFISKVWNMFPNIQALFDPWFLSQEKTPQKNGVHPNNDLHSITEHAGWPFQCSGRWWKAEKGGTGMMYAQNQALSSIYFVHCFCMGKLLPYWTPNIGSLYTQYASQPHLHKTLYRFVDEVILKSSFKNPLL